MLHCHRVLNNTHMNESPNFKRAVESGALIDVSVVARTIGLLCPTFVTTVFWESVEISCMNERLVAVLDEAYLIHESVCEGKTGVFRTACVPAVCPFGVGLTARVERFDGYGMVVVIGDPYEDLNFRIPRSPSGGSFFTM